ncbi:restriction endonuclease subunit S [Vibrio cholerae]|nr:restriction endonuclease subunit S [Vibrio parahaemolyticus]HCG9140773.1 restriction endonuclease subunit S [Vibrio parahaemolyticus]
MRSHYKRIGDYVTLVKPKNSDGAISSLKGININKHFMPSVANVNGTDLSTYRVVKKNQFAFNPMHVGRDEVLPISMLEDDEPIIVSPAYVVFEVKDEEELLPAYLMMWCRRSEFDRNAWFMTDNSVRGGFSWADFCDMELPVPSIEKQREIVREYNVVNDRIALNEQLTQKLEDTAQAIYKQWFVDFEFPISKEYAQSIGKPEQEGKPYKSSGGEMVFCEEIDKDIPVVSKTRNLGDLIESVSKTHDFKKDQLIFFNTSDILAGRFLHSDYRPVIGMPGQAKKSIKKGDILFSEIRPANKRFALVRWDSEDYVVSTKLMVIRPKSQEFSNLRFYHYLTLPETLRDFQQSAEGRSGTFPQITFDVDIEERKVVTLPEDVEVKWQTFLTSYYDYLFALMDEIELLKQMTKFVELKLSKL